MSPQSVLDQEDKDHFLTHGWIKKTDKSTWTRLRTNMPFHFTFDASEFAPRAWAAICELSGGEERVTPHSKIWKDSLIVNLGLVEAVGKPVHGDFFVHYLDSPEQGLLVTPLFTDIAPDAGGTVICPGAIPKMAKYLYEHPEGVSPRMTPRGKPGSTQEKNLDWFNSLARGCSHFVEATGPDGNYSLVEQVALRALGKDRLKDWKIAAAREEFIPERVRIQERMKLEELKRLELAEKGTAAA
ncbi:hypothetical protein B0T26DRAFT_813939 [Lasiosphaeria miniovina]|uniref:Uncharacterized protein n=1 Tax=Lasiosphaeria miniovina TaxID=1954250 RepID=A0AA40A4N8_9PEZI|nr:uncharacterized protein B0T26DRAFT_813939 [Lasiosphaeria miniovina]KAK0709111.1 hypothetical protein B0T26DRAFT_813939 [Lasiosphaeria miniovina]